MPKLITRAELKAERTKFNHVFAIEGDDSAKQLVAHIGSDSMGIEMVPVSEALTSWTRTLNVEDALTLVDSAYAGTSVEEWAERSDLTLPQASPARRRELIRIVRDELLERS